MIQLTDKHNQLKQFKDDLFNKTLAMFEWSNLPETLPQVELEKLLQINGFAVIAKYQGDLYAFNAGFTGQDAYQRPTQAIINNPALNLNQTFTIDEDCVVIKNDDMTQGLTKIFEKYGQLAIENLITMLMTDYNLRMPFTISSQDDSTTQSAREFLNKVIDGSLGVIGESKLFNSLNVTPTKNNSGSNFADLYGYQQYILAELNNTIGLATNNNMKRERLTTNEIEVNKNASYPLIDNMLRNRKQAVEKINAIFDTDISVEFSSIWGDTNDDDDDSQVDDRGTNEDINDNTTNDSVDDDTTIGNEQPVEMTAQVQEQEPEQEPEKEPEPEAEPEPEPEAEQEQEQEPEAEQEQEPEPEKKQEPEPEQEEADDEEDKKKKGDK